MPITKQNICDLLRSWINQRPGLEFGNYGDVSAYRSELRGITKDRREALQLLRAVELRESITLPQLLGAFRAYSGRLTCTIEPDPKKPGQQRARLDYCTGQYWPTEYRKAAAAVLASVLWEYVREECMPKPQGKVTRTTGTGPFARETEHDSIEGLSPGDWLRRYFRREFGRGIADRWFN